MIRGQDLQEWSEMSFLGRLKLWQKLAVLVVAMAIPTVLLQVFYLNQVNRVVQTGRDELDGARYLQALGAVASRIADHRSLSHALLNGDATRRAETLTAESEIDRLLNAVDTVDQELGSFYQTTQRWKDTESSWSTLKANLSKLTPEQSLKQHDEVLDRIAQVRTAVAMVSKLSLDDDASTYTLINVATE